MSGEISVSVDAGKVAAKAKALSTASSRVDLFFSGDAKRTVLKDTAITQKAAQIQRSLGLCVVERSNETRNVLPDPKSPHHEAEIPLVWSVVLPTKHRTVTVSTHAWSSCHRFDYDVSSPVPLPPAEALDALEKYQGIFDSFELWWIPCNLTFVRRPDPDPMVVGVLKGGTGPIYFELYRWIDETVEDPLDNATGY